MRLALKLFAVVLILAGVLTGGCVLIMAPFAFEGDPGLKQLWIFGAAATVVMFALAAWLFRLARRGAGDDGG